MKSPRTKRSGALINLALLGVALVVAAGLGEAVIRLLEPRSDHQRLMEMRPDSERRWALLPDRDVIRVGVRIRTNRFGQRGGDYAPAKPPGTFRIVGLGDSYTFGSGVEYEDTYLRVLERLLNDGFEAGESGNGEWPDMWTGAPDTQAAPGIQAEAPGLQAGATRFETINFGVAGYNTRQEAAYYREAGDSLAPDLVLVGFVYNDVEQSVIRQTDGVPMTNPGLKRGAGRGGLTRAILGLKQRSHLFSTLSPRIGALLRVVGVQGVGEVGGFAQAYADSSPGWRAARGALLELRDRTAARGARLAVIVLPAFVSLDRRQYPLHPYHQAVTAFCRDHDIPVLDTYPVFEGKRAGRYWISINDPHPNAEANRMIAESIRRFLIDSRLVPAPGMLHSAG